MRRIMTIFAVLTVLVLASCQRRPFAEHTTEVNIVLNVKTDIVINDEVPMPETMRIGLYETDGGSVQYTDYISSTGGLIHPKPGTYDLVVYNIGTESTQIRNEKSHDDIEAFTSEVSSFLKSQLGKFLEKRAQAQAKAEPEAKEEKIVFEPDHLFVGHLRQTEIPALLEDGDDIEIHLNVDAHSVVETWNVEIPNVDGVEYVQKAVAIISGQAGSHFIGREEDSSESVSIYFEMSVDKETGVLFGKFNTFGKHPEAQSVLSLDINLTDTGGKEHHYHFDVDSDFMDNPALEIVIEDEVKVEQPTGGGGGFVPTVNDWDEVRTEINI
ncbi:MAG: DUF5119 domain-containing protein [Bacteroidales bacterium]|nr:DUF5119 domain-containing protein [Bacteroidales bacterium]